MKRIIIIVFIVIVILTFVIPIRKGTKREIIMDTNPPGFYGGGSTTVETFNVYYNLYGIQIIKISTGEVEVII